MPKRRKTCVPFHHRPVLTSGTLQLWDLHDELILNQIIIVRETAERDDKKSASTTTKQRLVCMGVSLDNNRSPGNAGVEGAILMETSLPSYIGKRHSMPVGRKETP